MKNGTTMRLTYVWLALSAVTVLSWWLGHRAHAGGHLVASTPITIGVLTIAAVKVFLVLREFMEVRTAPTWLRLVAGFWLVAFFGTVLGIYLA
jgi:hypothetical protein